MFTENNNAKIDEIRQTCNVLVKCLNLKQVESLNLILTYMLLFIKFQLKISLKCDTTKVHKIEQRKERLATKLSFQL